MKRFNFFKYTTLGNKVHTTYFDYWFFKHLTQGGEPVTPAVEGEGTEFTLEPTSNKKLAVVSLKGDTTQNTLTGKNKISMTPFYTGGNIYNKDAGFQYTNTFSSNVTIINQDENSLSYSSTSAYEGVVIVSEPLTEGQTYRLSGSINISDNSIRATSYVLDSAYTIVRRVGNSNLENINQNVTIGAGEIYVAYALRGNTTDYVCSITNLQLEEGSTATTFEPYCGGIPSPNPDYPQDVNVVTGTQTLTITNGEDVQTYPITLGSLELVKIGTYQDYIYKSGDDWYVHKTVDNITLTGSNAEDWHVGNSTGSTDCLYCHSGIIDDLSESTEIQTFAKCSHFINANKGLTSQITDNISEFVIGTSTSRIRLLVRKEIATNKTTWETWLSTNNPIIYYALATPTDTKITDNTLIADLNDLLSTGYLKKGTNTIQTTATGTNLPTIIYIKSN